MAFSEDQLRAWGVDLSQVTTSKRQPIAVPGALVLPDPKQRNKYHAQPTEYNGRRYDSKAEASHAAQLDREKALGFVRLWLPQPIVPLEPGVIYRPDFFVLETAGVARFDEVKGRDTERFRVIVKLWRLHGPASLHVHYRKHVEIIEVST